jgi:asparagine synthase (glutamine-hydrolysing)
MCGIAGIVGEATIARLQAMERAQAHRGPDDRGLYRSAPFDPAAPRDDADPTAPGSPADAAPRCGFVHSRLAIMDLSPLGHQPRSYRDHGIQICYNGELYNFAEIRAELIAEGYTFESTGDTEVLLAAFGAWGVERTLPRLHGDFAIALWDERRRTFHLMRDHTGVKPLYWAATPRGFAFASEIKAIVASGLVSRDLDFDALQSCMMSVWIPAPATILREVRALRPGWRATIRVADNGAIGEPKFERWWSPIGAARRLRVMGGGATGDLERDADTLDALLLRAVERRMIADVPLGAFLSGGLDSSLIVAMMRKLAGEAPRTYTIRFAEEDQQFERMAPDADYAALLAKRFGCRAREFCLQPDVAALLPRIVRTLDQPIGDPAAINTLLICEAARPEVTVLLSGQGADELFGGYRKHLAVVLAGMYKRALPAAVRHGVVEPLAARLPVAGRDRGYRLFRWARRFLANASAPTFDSYLGNFVYARPDEVRAMLAPDVRDRVPATLDDTWFSRAHAEAWSEAEVALGDDATPLSLMGAADTSYFLPDLNLQYGDKASMAVGLETRVPFCDDELVAWAGTLGDSARLGWNRRGPIQKRLLKMVARRYLPNEIIDRPKAPFGAPLRSWTRGALDTMIGDLLGADAIRRRGLFDAGAIARVVDDNRSGKADHAHRLWQLLTIETWCRVFLDEAN